MSICASQLAYEIGTASSFPLVTIRGYSRCVVSGSTVVAVTGAGPESGSSSSCTRESACDAWARSVTTIRTPAASITALISSAGAEGSTQTLVDPTRSTARWTSKAAAEFHIQIPTRAWWAPAAVSAPATPSIRRSSSEPVRAGPSTESSRGRSPAARRASLARSPATAINRSAGPATPPAAPWRRPARSAAHQRTRCAAAAHGRPVPGPLRRRSRH